MAQDNRVLELKRRADAENLPAAELENIARQLRNAGHSLDALKITRRHPEAALSSTSAQIIEDVSRIATEGKEGSFRLSQKSIRSLGLADYLVNELCRNAWKIEFEYAQRFPTRGEATVGPATLRLGWGPSHGDALYAHDDYSSMTYWVRELYRDELLALLRVRRETEKHDGAFEFVARWRGKGKEEPRNSWHNAAFMILAGHHILQTRWDVRLFADSRKARLAAFCVDEYLQGSLNFEDLPLKEDLHKLFTRSEKEDIYRNARKHWPSDDGRIENLKYWLERFDDPAYSSSQELSSLVKERVYTASTILTGTSKPAGNHLFEQLPSRRVPGNFELTHEDFIMCYDGVDLKVYYDTSTAFMKGRSFNETVFAKAKDVVRAHLLCRNTPDAKKGYDEKGIYYSFKLNQNNLERIAYLQDAFS
jgi:hypothetical protein